MCVMHRGRNILHGGHDRPQRECDSPQRGYVRPQRGCESLHCGFNRPHRGKIPQNAFASHAKAVTAYIEDATVNIEDATSHIAAAHHAHRL